MADIFTEVDEALKAERAKKIWDRYGNAILGGALLIVAATAVYSGAKSWNQHRDEKGTAAIVGSIDAPDLAKAMQEASEKAEKPGQKAIALLSAAGALAGKEDDDAKALPLYRQVADDASAPEVLRDYALLMTARLRLKAEGTGADAAALLKDIESVYDKADSPWKHIARIDAAAVLADLRTDYQGAADHLAVVLGAPDVSESLLERARALQHIYLMKAAAQKDKGEAADNKESQG